MLQVHPKKSTSVRRPSRPFSRWVTARKIVQGITLLVFIVLFIQARHGGWPAVLTNLPMRLDPLAVLLHLISSRTILAGSALALIVVAITLLAGRAWCGWLCPLGTVLDLFPLYRASKNQPKLSENWRAVKYAVLLVLLVAAFFGNLTLLVLDPLTIVFRTLSTAIWPALDRVVTAVETTLYNLPGLGDSISTVDTWVRPALFPAAPAFYRDAWLFAFVFFGVIALNIFAPRFWCRYLCPLGGLLGLLSKFAFFRRKVLVQDCKSCALC
jgi:polyferredoxin